ncbi:hypothetical protein JTB14_007546 [Gonioctena quinquepunctata]|nr:hypothetical protein JTB14_007546 [Gonioctena quinquepunctata]
MKFFVVVLFCIWHAQESVINVESFDKGKSKLVQPAVSQAHLREWFPYDIAKLVKGYGYPFEKHSVTTEDGYNLEIHRVPYGKSGSQSEGKPAVLIMHDILGTSAQFFISGQGSSLPLQLADQGYDVWVGNNRGNTWSRSNVNMKPDNKTFWNFSFHELGIHDDPAMIDYILRTTKNDKLSLVGYSQGATQFFVMLSEKPEYNDKVTIMTAMAPLVYMGKSTNLIFRLLSKIDILIQEAEKKFNIAEFLPHSDIFKLAGDILCSNGSKFQGICSTLLAVLMGFDQEHIDKSILPTFLSVFPGGSSIKGIKHLAQETDSGFFRQYDYGLMENRKTYNSSTPPSYDLSKVTVPVALHFAKNDWLVAVSDKERLVADLGKNVVEDRLVGFEKFNHMDYILDKDASSTVNFYVNRILNKHNGLPDVTTTTTTISPEPSSDSASTSSPPSEVTNIPSQETTTPSQETTASPSGSSRCASTLSSITLLSCVLTGLSTILTRYHQ